jgi:hypothetical protein
VDTQVDILVANWNTLPWLRLLVSQAKRFLPTVSHTIHVWDGGSTDGSSDWLSRQNISLHASKEHISHAQSLTNLIAVTNAPYIALMDVDTMPVGHGWLDEAIAALGTGKTGAAGLPGGQADGRNRLFVHPSFCVIKRDLYEKLNTSLEIFYDFSNKIAFDVGVCLSKKIEDEGYALKFLGSNEADRAKMMNKVFHFRMATIGLGDGGDPSSCTFINQVVKGHEQLLRHFGLWDEFKTYLQESSALNPHCRRYLDA